MSSERGGASRFDLRDPYHLAVALTWPQFLAALPAFYLSVNVVFATLYWLVPGSVAHARPGSFADALSVGMFLQTLLLALTERDLGSCVEVSIAGYPEIVRAQLGIPAELSILCGLAVGYPDPDFAANKLHVGREPIGENVVFLDS